LIYSLNTLLRNLINIVDWEYRRKQIKEEKIGMKKRGKEKELLLWVEALSGKYLSNGISFLDVDVKPQSSWIWKGLLKNRKLLLKGACWSISKGDFIDVWKFSWIPSMPCLKPRSKENLLVFPAYSVADLILHEERLWNVDLLHDLFDPITIQNILQIHLSWISTEDKWSWIPPPSGIFTVKSARKVC